MIGAGPAGCHRRAVAARARRCRSCLSTSSRGRAARSGARRPAASTPHSIDAEARQGRCAARAARRSRRSTLRLGRRVWSVTSGFRVDAIGPDGHEAFTAPRLIAATGAHERVVPFPGWTLPGVIGLAAATVLLKSQAMLPGRRIVVAGCGPLLLRSRPGIVEARRRGRRGRRSCPGRRTGSHAAARARARPSLLGARSALGR